MLRHAITAAGLVSVLAGFLGCGGQPSQTPATAQQEGRPAMKITSSAFAEGAAIPKQHTDDGANVSPALRWTGTPASTIELALIVDDPDAPRPKPWVHWILYKIPASLTGLPQGASGAGRQPETPMREGRGDGGVGYRGPAPPRGHGVHHYHFKLYALDAPLDLPAGATKEEHLAAMKGHVLAVAETVGTYERQPGRADPDRGGLQSAAVRGRLSPTRARAGGTRIAGGLAR
jgi:Raf kinase inhibitor-like YbhB/YbcL family protein